MPEMMPKTPTLALERNGLPAAWLELDARQLAEQLPGPALIHLPGRRQPPLFVSILLHGNETTGWLAVRALLQRYAGRPLPRAMSLLIGNVAAARLGRRKLDDQPDYNRIWSPRTAPHGTLPPLARQVLDTLRGRGLFAAVDVHNNSGVSPQYGCINRLDGPWLNLAALFGRTTIWFTKPDGVMSLALAELAPSITLECGQIGNQAGIAHAIEYLDACLHLAEISPRFHAPHDLDLFHTVATVRIAHDVSVDFVPGADLQLCHGLDRSNFSEMPAGTLWGRVASHGRMPVQVTDLDGQDVTWRHFAVEDGQLVTRGELVPAMLTEDLRVMRQDCLCYLMERVVLSGDHRR